MNAKEFCLENRDFYRLEEAAEKLGVAVADILHQADRGALVLSASLAGKDVFITRNREDGYSGTLMPEIAMMFELPGEVARIVARNGSAVVKQLSGQDGNVLIKINTPFSVSASDLFLTKKEIDCFVVKASAAGAQLTVMKEAVDSSEKKSPETQEADQRPLIPGNQPRISIGKLAIKAAWEIECASGRAATAQAVIERLQFWADNGREPAILIRSDKKKRGLWWLPVTGKEKLYDVEACGKALQRWMESRRKPDTSRIV